MSVKIPVMHIVESSFVNHQSVNQRRCCSWNVFVLAPNSCLSLTPVSRKRKLPASVHSHIAVNTEFLWPQNTNFPQPASSPAAVDTSCSTLIQILSSNPISFWHHLPGNGIRSHRSGLSSQNCFGFQAHPKIILPELLSNREMVPTPLPWI